MREIDETTQAEAVTVEFEELSDDLLDDVVGGFVLKLNSKLRVTSLLV